jgi:hypothetical protein
MHRKMKMGVRRNPRWRKWVNKIQNLRFQKSMHRKKKLIVVKKSLTIKKIKK